MEALTRLVSESFARHGFDRPIDYRRLKWSRWFRCESHHSLLLVPSKPGIFALAEDVGSAPAHETVNADPYQGMDSPVLHSELDAAACGSDGRHILAVTQFFEADDMAFILDRMLSRYNPMRARLESGRYFVRFVVIEEESQRQSIYRALNQWIHSSGEKSIGGHFATSPELRPATEHVPAPDDSQANLFSSAEMGRVVFSAHATTAAEPVPSVARGNGSQPEVNPKQPAVPAAAPRPFGADTRIQSPPVFPSGF